MTLTYKEQLAHPNWQRKRLEMLDAADFTCFMCEATDSTLHVHHRQYFKNRMAWEYGNDQLVVLCDACHKKEHEAIDCAKKLQSLVNPVELTALAHGFHSKSDWIPEVDKEDGRSLDPLTYAAGFIAWMAAGLADIEQMKKVAEFAATMMSEESEHRLHFIFGSDQIFGRTNAK